jgi:hypothetical protein
MAIISDSPAARRDKWLVVEFLLLPRSVRRSRRNLVFMESFSAGAVFKKFIGAATGDIINHRNVARLH